MDGSSSQGQLFRTLLLSGQAVMCGHGCENGGQMRQGCRGLYDVLGFEEQAL
jgi:hypothetical protein